MSADRGTEKSPPVKLKPWAKLKGSITVAGKPLANQKMSVQPLTHFPAFDNSIHSYSRITTNAAGEFQIAKVGPHPVSLMFTIQSKTDKSKRTRINIPFELAPGESRDAEFNFDYAIDSPGIDPGITKHLQLDRSSCGFRKIDNWQNLLPAEFKAANKPLGGLAETIKLLESKEDWKTMFLLSNITESTTGEVQKDGSISAHISGPGKWQVSTRYSGVPGSSDADISVCDAIDHQQVFEIKDGVHRLEPLDVKFTAPAKIGESVPDFKIETEAATVSSEEIKGKVVLLDFWNDSSKHVGSSNQAIAKLKSAVQVDDPLAILSLNCFPGSAKLQREIPTELSHYSKSISLDREAYRDLCPKFGAWNVPLAVVIDQKGKLRFSGTHSEAVEIVRELLHDSN